MNNKKQSGVSEIFTQFNLLSDSDFKSWMLNNKDRLEAMHQDEIESAFAAGILKDVPLGRDIFPKEFYKETYGE